VDTRAEREVDELSDLFGADEILRRGGSALSSQALGPKLAWLRRHEPRVYAATRRWHMASSFVVARLTGRWALDHQSASQCDPLYDLADECWSRDWAELAVPGLALPDLRWPGEIVGEVHAAGAAATGLRPGTPVVCRTIDAWAEAVSVGVRRPGDLMIMYGSTMFIVLYAERPARHSAIWRTAGVDPGSVTLAAGLATSGSLTAWLQGLTGDPPFADLVAEAATVPAGSDGLLLLPYFAGERTPILDPSARGTIVGLTLEHGRAELYRAILEGTAFAARHNLETMAPDAQLRAVAVGGGTHGRLWTQIVSDVTGVPQAIPVETIGACYGDALLAAEGVALASAGSSWARTAECVKPVGERRPLYDDLYRHYRALYPATKATQHALARLQMSMPRGDAPDLEASRPPLGRT
jgi:xylulokinase